MAKKKQLHLMQPLGIKSRLCRCAGILNLTVQGGYSSSILGSSDERRSRLLNESHSRCT